MKAYLNNQKLDVWWLSIHSYNDLKDKTDALYWTVIIPNNVEFYAVKSINRISFEDLLNE